MRWPNHVKPFQWKIRRLTCLTTFLKTPSNSHRRISSWSTLKYGRILPVGLSPKAPKKMAGSPLSTMYDLPDILAEVGSRYPRRAGRYLHPCRAAEYVSQEGSTQRWQGRIYAPPSHIFSGTDTSITGIEFQVEGIIGSRMSSF
jgi:hypothetical protein